MATHALHDDQLRQITLSLPYRNDRNYIHSTDIFEALVNLAKTRFSSDAYVESLMLRKQAVRQIFVSFEALPQMAGTFSVRTKGVKVDGWFAETDIEVRDRIAYDESRAAAAVVGGLGYSRFTEPVAGFTAFEQLLVLIKVAGGFGKNDAWLCQTNLRGPLLNTQPLAVRLQHKAMQRFLVFEIMQNEETIGHARGFLRSQGNDSP